MAKTKKFFNWINGEAVSENINENDWLEKYDPHSGELQSLFIDSSKKDVELAIETAQS